MTQTGFVESMLSNFFLNSTPKTKNIPTQEVLHPDKFGAGFKDSVKWKYQSIIVNINSLAINKIPDIIFAVQ